MSEQEIPIATEGELDLTVIAPADRGLRVFVVFRELLAGDVLGETVAQRAERFPVRGALPIPTLTAFLRLETRINNALGADEEDADRELEAAMTDAHDRIIGLIAERNLAAFRPCEIEVEERTVRVKPAVELDVSGILVVLAWLAGDVSVADAVARALTAGKTGAVDAPDAGSRQDDGEASAAVEDAEPAAPFGSR